MAESLHALLSRPAWEAAEAFARLWFGVEPRPAPEVPERVRRAYEVVAGAELTVAWLLDPSQIAEDDGRLVFFIDATEEYVWGLAGDGSVWMRENAGDAAWRPGAPDLGVFVVQLLLVNAAMDPDDERHSAYSSYLQAEALSAYRPLQLPPWPEGARHLASETAVVFAQPAGDGLMAWVAALDPRGLPDGEDWDYVSARDD